MRTGGVLNILGKLLILLSLFLLTPIPFSLYYGDGMVRVFLLSSVVGALIGGLLVAIFAPEKDLGYRDGFGVVVRSWVGLAFLGALPCYLSGHIPSIVVCFF
jgi:trk system potassium uptake protein TrkH